MNKQNAMVSIIGLFDDLKKDKLLTNKDKLTLSAFICGMLFELSHTINYGDDITMNKNINTLRSGLASVHEGFYKNELSKNKITN